MKIAAFPFQTLNWASVPREEHPGETGFSLWQTQWVNDIRVRLVEYSPGYTADHWCNKGHILYCLRGELATELKSGSIARIGPGMCYFVGDDSEAHRSSTANGCLLLIVD